MSTQTEPPVYGWYKDTEDGECWLFDENGWRLLDSYGSGGGFEVDRYRDWEEVSRYGTIRKAGRAYVVQELELATKFAYKRVAESHGTLEVFPVLGSHYGVGNLVSVGEFGKHPDAFRLGYEARESELVSRLPKPKVGTDG